MMQPKKAEKEMRGVWVSYIELDMQNETDKSEASFREKFKNIAITSKNAGFNTLIVPSPFRFVTHCTIQNFFLIRHFDAANRE